MTEYGIHDYRSYRSIREDFPGATHSREFVPGVHDPSTTDLADKILRAARPALFAGFTPWVSFKLNPQDVVAGKWDEQLEHVGLTIPSQVKLIPWHDPEYDMSASDFCKMFARVARYVKRVDPYLELVYSAMACQYRPGSSTTKRPEEWFPEDADIYAVDVHSGQSFPLETILPEHPGFVRWDKLRPRGKPWAVTDRGFLTANKHQQRVATIDREAAWLVDSDCSTYIYWNTEGVAGSPVITLNEKYAVQRLMLPPPTPAPEDRYNQGYDDGYAAGLRRGQDDGYSQALADAMAMLDRLADDE